MTLVLDTGAIVSSFEGDRVVFERVLQYIFILQYVVAYFFVQSNLSPPPGQINADLGGLYLAKARTSNFRT